MASQKQIVICCPTKEIWDYVNDHILGPHPDCKINPTRWSDYKEQTCVRVIPGQKGIQGIYADLEFYQSQNVEIIALGEYLKRNPGCKPFEGQVINSYSIY